MVHQREVVGGADVIAVFRPEWDSPGAALAGGAGDQYEDVAQQTSEGVVRAPGDGGRDEEVRGALEQRHLPACRRTQGIGVPAPPVLVDQRAVAAVADAGRAP